MVGQLCAATSPVELGGTEQGCLHQALAGVPDPRDRRGVRHELAGLLAMTAAGVLAGSRSFYAIEGWPSTSRIGKMRSDRSPTFLA
jgi:hypothetical protein